MPGIVRTVVGGRERKDIPVTEPERLRVTVVRAPACHLCEDAMSALSTMARERSAAIDVTLLDAADPAGRALVDRHRPGLFPLVLVDGEFFAAGRLPRGKLARLLAARGPSRVG